MGKSQVMFNAVEYEADRTLSHLPIAYKIWFLHFILV